MRVYPLYIFFKLMPKFCDVKNLLGGNAEQALATHATGLRCAAAISFEMKMHYIHSSLFIFLFVLSHMCSDHFQLDNVAFNGEVNPSKIT